MIWLTGDVHQDSIRTSHRPYQDGSEAALAVRYARVAASHGVKATLFVTGRSCIEHRAEIRELSNFDNVEIGGHTWSALRPRALHGLFYRVWGSRYGPPFYQRRDIRRTLEAIEKVTGRRPVCWRTHAYVSDRHTSDILAEFGIHVLSDAVEVGAIGPVRTNGAVRSVPINTWPDHEHIYHAGRTVAHVAKEVAHGVENAASVPVGEWLTLVIEQVRTLAVRNGLATLLVHPACMWAADHFESFTRLCEFLSAYQTGWSGDCAIYRPSSGDELGTSRPDCFSAR